MPARTYKLAPMERVHDGRARERVGDGAPRYALTSGWPIVGWSALAIETIVATILALTGTGENGLRMAIRATARTSIALFLPAFVASAASRRWPTRASRWLLANRRYLGVSFAVSHFTHLLAILALTGWSPRRFVTDAGPTAALLGGVGYVFIAAMTATSFDRSAAWLGPRRWKQLHTAGVYYLWGVFFVSYAPRAVTGSVLYAALALALLAALGLRLTGRARAHGRAAVSAASKEAP